MTPVPHSLVHLVLIQPSPFCNIDCTYCYLPDRHVTARMSREKLAECFAFLFKNPNLVSNKVRILWHSGEPLAVPISFYREALEMEQRYCPPGTHITNSIQSNGTLLNDDWVEFIKEAGFTIGISLDGPAEFHDATRVTRSGKGTFVRVESAISLLVQAGIPFHVITVLNDRTIDQPEILWDTYRRLGITRIHFLIEELQGVHTIRQLRQSALQDRLERFFSVIDEKRRLENNPALYIRELDDNLAKLRALPEPYREIEQLPLGILSVTYKGDVATFSPELVGTTNLEHGKFVFANTATDSLEQILNHPVFRSTYRSILSGYARCKRSCNYYTVCGGGQPSIKLYENGSFDSTETPSCQMRIKAAVNVVLRRLPTERRTLDMERLCEKLAMPAIPEVPRGIANLQAHSAMEG